MTIFSYKKLYMAYLDCRKTKRKTLNALKFEINLEENLMKLLEELRNGTYRPGRSICFIVIEPSPREIFAADFRDRIVHHLFVRELLDMAERKFIYDSYACRKGKGTHRAVSRLYSFARQVTDNFRHEAWFMKIDLRSFFMSINHDILYRLVLDLINKGATEPSSEASDLGSVAPGSVAPSWKNDLARLAKTIIFHKPAENYIRKGDPKLAALIPPHKSLLNQSENKGLPIGNYSSQFFANLYLNRLDHFIKRELKCKFYLRYVDDLVFLSASAEKLKDYREFIKIFANKNLQLMINDKKTIIQPLARGLDFLGYFLKAGRIYPRHCVNRRYKNKLFQAVIGRKERPWRQLWAIAASYRGHAGYFNLAVKSIICAK